MNHQDHPPPPPPPHPHCPYVGPGFALEALPPLPQFADIIQEFDIVSAITNKQPALFPPAPPAPEYQEDALSAPDAPQLAARYL